MWTENFYIGDNLSLWSFWANPNSISSICESVICRQDETAVRTVCFLEKKTVYHLEKGFGPTRRFCTGCHRANFLKIDKGGQTLTISTHEMAPMRAVLVLQNWPKIAKMTLNDLFSRTEQKTLLVS